MEELSYVEQAAGKRADFKIFYTREGKPYWDVMWADNAEQAIERFNAGCASLGWKNVVVQRAETMPKD